MLGWGWKLNKSRKTRCPGEMRDCVAWIGMMEVQMGKCELIPDIF